MHYKLRGFPAFCFWLFCLVLSFWICDRVGTRPLYIEVEDFRKPHMTDEQVLSVAVQKGYDEAPNFWWFHSRRVALIFDQKRAYNLPPDLLESLYEKKPHLENVDFDIEIASFPIINPFR